jgi:uncharacterized protein YbjT (DUF2867 family)
MWAVVSKWASLGHDVAAMVRDVQAASRRLPSGIALRVADYEDASALKGALAGLNALMGVARREPDGSKSEPTGGHWLTP